MRPIRKRIQRFTVTFPLGRTGTDAAFYRFAGFPEPEKVTEVARWYIAAYSSRFAAYLALERALMRRFVARGGTAEEFCSRLGSVFHRRYAPLFLDGRETPTAGVETGAQNGRMAALPPVSRRLRQECFRRAA